jgi:hypothetical protein
MQRSKKSDCKVSPNVVLDKESRKNMGETVGATKTKLLKSLPLVLKNGYSEDIDRLLLDTNELLVEFKELNKKHMSIIRQIYGIIKQPKEEKQEYPIFMYTGKPSINITGYLGNMKTTGQNKDER